MAVTVTEAGSRYLIGTEHAEEVKQPYGIQISLGAFNWDKDI